MYLSANLGLTIWDQAGDDFNHSQLLANWLQIDTHDHSANKGVQIGTAGIANNAITAPKIAPGSITNAALQALSIATSNIQNNAITAAQIAPGAITGNLIPTGGVSVTQLDPTIIPLGFVALWWRPPGSNAVPGGVWEAMDGRAWSSITNAFGLTTGNIPDTRGVFVKGANMTGGPPGPAIAATGGSASINLAHTHNVLGHTHTTPAHTHTISNDGSHYHTWQNGLAMWSRTNAFPIGMTVYDWSGTQRQNTFFSMYIKNLLSNPAWSDPDADNDANNPNADDQVTDGHADMDTAGIHNHGGATGSAGASTTGSSTSTTDSQLGSSTIDPPWTGLVYIMRCR